MAVDCEGKDFEWVDPTVDSIRLWQDLIPATPSSDFLKEGYLHVMEKQSSSPVESMSTISRAKKLMQKLSDPALLGSWSRRWCVFSHTQDHFHLLLYKDESSFSNLHTPCAVLSLDSCSKLSSLPTQYKSENTFALTLDKREILFYTDTSSELEEWLKVLEGALHLQDAYCNSPLKGLPQQKASRRDSHLSPTSPTPSSTIELPSSGIKPPANKTSTAVSMGIVATAPSEVTGRQSNSKPATVKRSISFNIIRRNPELPVKVLQVKQIDS